MELTTYYLETFGCQMNVLDSELVAELLRTAGLQRVNQPSQADVILFNTCSVRQHAEDKVLSRLGHLKRHKQRRPEIIIGVLGCMAQRMQDEIFTHVPHVDLICAPAQLPQLTTLLEQVGNERRPVSALSHNMSRRTVAAARADEHDPLEVLDLSRRPAPLPGGLQSYIRVQRGCDKFCTYCVVPYTRGPEQSRPPANILREAQALVDAGCREITLLGQTVNSYAFRENSRVVGLAELLERVHEIPDLWRLRFVTSYPADFDPAIFRAIRDLPKVCPYLHIPAQSGSDRMLKAMKRGYTADEYLHLMDQARAHVPDIALAGDFIVGFSGETESDFQQTVSLIQRVQYKSLFIFKYSARPGTTADRAQTDDIPQETKARRNNELLAIQNEIGLRQKQALVGTEVEVLVEGYSKAARKAQKRNTHKASSPDDEPIDAEVQRGSETTRDVRRQLVGRTPHDLITVFDGDPQHIGTLARVRIDRVSPLTLFGSLT